MAFSRSLMASGARPSPRAAIRDWLACNSEASGTPAPRLDFTENLQTERVPQEQPRVRSHRDASKAPWEPGSRILRNRQSGQNDSVRERPGMWLHPLPKIIVLTL